MKATKGGRKPQQTQESPMITNAMVIVQIDGKNWHKTNIQPDALMKFITEYANKSVQKTIPIFPVPIVEIKMLPDEHERTRPADKEGRYEIYCPACKCMHFFNTDPKHPSNVDETVWYFNKNLSRPTFAPSMKWDNKGKLCHSTVIDGYIQFEHDCEHELKGQIIELDPLNTNAKGGK